MLINVTDFMNKFNSKKTDDEKLKLVKHYIKNEYIPYEKKADYASLVVDSSYWVVNDEEKTLHVNSVAKHMLACMAVVELFTDIERDKDKDTMLDSFNALNGSGALDLIINNIDERELKEFNMVLQMTCDDVITNEYENHAFIIKQVDRFGKLIGNAIVPVLSTLDTEKIEELIKSMV